MRYLFMVHGDTEAEAAMTPDERMAIVREHMAYADLLRERGVHVLGEALSGEAAVVRPGDPPLVTDGPFADTKEGVGGFYLVDCATREEAIELAGRVPRSPGVARGRARRRRSLRRRGRLRRNLDLRLALRRPADGQGAVHFIVIGPLEYADGHSAIVQIHLHAVFEKGEEVKREFGKATCGG